MIRLDTQQVALAGYATIAEIVDRVVEYLNTTQPT